MTDHPPDVIVPAMTTSRAMVLQAVTIGELPRVHICKDPLELSDALATEMARALDPEPIRKWMENPRFYDYWKDCFEGSERMVPNSPKPRPCLYMDGTKRYTLATVLTVCTET